MRRIAIVFAALLLSLGLVASPAHAATFTWCFLSQICAAEHANGEGARLFDSGPVGACQPLGGFWNDRISSMKNTFVSEGGWVMFWRHAGCDGQYNALGPGQTRNSLVWYVNDTFSSYCIGPTDFAGTNSCGQYTLDG